MPWKTLFREAEGKLDLKKVSTDALHKAAVEHKLLRNESTSVCVGELLAKLNCSPEEAEKVIRHLAHTEASQNYSAFYNFNTQQYHKLKKK